jgi:hypothetical protein
MTLPIFKNGDALYTIIYRHEDAKARLIKWSNTSRSIQSRIDDNKLYLYDHNSLSLFIVNWSFSWDNVLIWDCYAKRHINV